MADETALVSLAHALRNVRQRQQEGILGVLTQQLHGMAAACSGTASGLSDRGLRELFCCIGELLAQGTRGTPADDMDRTRLPEEACVAAWGCLTALYAAAGMDLCTAALRRPTMRLRVGHLVSLSLDFASDTETGRVLRKRAVTGLVELWRAVGDSGGVMACFYPGVASGLAKVIAGCTDARQGHALTTVLSRLVHASYTNIPFPQLPAL